MRRLLLLAYAANVAFTAGSLLLLPDTIAVHFGAGGEPDRWASKGSNSALMLALFSFMAGMFLFIPWSMRRLPARYFNLPNRDYWLDPRNVELAAARLTALTDELGTVVQLFFLAVGAMTLIANLSDPVRLDEPSFYLLLAMFLGYVAYWTLRLVRGFRLPQDAHRP